MRRFNGDGDHFGNFVQAVRSRRREELSADIEEGHLSSALCHLGNISYRLGRPTSFNSRVRAFEDDADAGATMTLLEEHLGDNQVPLDRTNYVLGRRLALRRGEETFENDSEANLQLTREYRRGFEGPGRVPDSQGEIEQASRNVVTSPPAVLGSEPPALPRLGWRLRALLRGRNR